MKLFNFEKQDIQSYIEYELKTFNKLKEPLNYVILNLIKNGNSLTIEDINNINLNKVKEREGKNYHWSLFVFNDINIVVRRYHSHLTIFTKSIKEKRTEYGCFTFNTNFEKFGDKSDEMHEKYYSKPFTGLNEIIVDLLKLLLSDKDYGVHWVWNSACLSRPDYVDIKLAFSGKNISNMDNFIFCMEELSSIFHELFAENTMLERLKVYKPGDSLNERYIIKDISTKVDDGYYHSVGLTLIDTSNKESWEDVYSLTRWYLEDIFKSLVIYKGEVYTIDSQAELVVGDLVASQDNDGEYYVSVLTEDHIKEYFSVLKKFN